MIQPAAATSPLGTSSRFDSTVDLPQTTTLVERVWQAPRIVWWGAIVAGAVAAIAIQVLFAILGTAIGLSVVGAAEDASAQGLSIAGAVYWLITGLISLFVGGMIAGRLRGTANGTVTAMHGFLTWCTVTVVSALMLMMAGGAAVGGSLGVVGQVLADDNSHSLSQSTRTALDPSRSSTLAAGAEQPVADGRAPQDSSMRVTEEDAKQAAHNAAVASWWTLLALVLGAGIASVGGKTGCVNREDSIVREDATERTVSRL